MEKPISNGNQASLNLVLPIGSWLGLNLVKLISYVKARALVEATDQVGTVHYLRFVDLHYDNQLGFFTAYDGEFRKYIQDFVRCLGPVFDAVFKFVVNPPQTPVAKNTDEFIDWIAAHNRDAIGFYSAYPTMTVQDVKAQSQAGSAGVGRPFALTFILPIKTPTNFLALSQFLRTTTPELFRAADAMGTVHFARFVPLSSTQLAFIGDFDGNLRTSVHGLAKHVGSLFNALLEHVVDPPPLPVEKNADAFVDWIASRNLAASLYYSAYPSLTVRNITTHTAVA